MSVMVPPWLMMTSFHSLALAALLMYSRKYCICSGRTFVPAGNEMT